jgi:hypothetical protein
MGTHGFRRRKVLGGHGAPGRPARFRLLLALPLTLPVLAGCSSSFNSSQAVNAPPPPPVAQAPVPGQAGYPPPGAVAAAPPPAAPANQGTSAGSLRDSYVGFLNMFRDPPDQSADDARASIYPKQSLADQFKGSTQPQPDANPTAGAYPQQSLVDTFRGSTAPAQTAQMPHPPGTYTPSAQPYVPPPAQTYAAPASATQPAYSAPPRYAGAAPAAADAGEYEAAAAAYPYPRQSLIDVFKGSTDSSAAAQQTMPRPPPSYTPSGQPYSPPPGQQPAYGQAAAAPPPAAPPPAPTPQQIADEQAANAYPYPRQNLLDIFSSKAAQ